MPARARTEGEEVVELRVGEAEAAAERRLPSEQEGVAADVAAHAAAAAVGAAGVEAGRHGVERPPLQLQLQQLSFLRCLHGAAAATATLGMMSRVTRPPVWHRERARGASVCERAVRVRRPGVLK